MPGLMGTLFGTAECSVTEDSYFQDSMILIHESIGPPIQVVSFE